MLMERYRPRTKVRGRESPSDDDDIIATMVMVFADSGSEIHAKSHNFPMTFKYQEFNHIEEDAVKKVDSFILLNVAKMPNYLMTIQKRNK